MFFTMFINYIMMLESFLGIKKEKHFFSRVSPARFTMKIVIFFLFAIAGAWGANVLSAFWVVLILRWVVLVFGRVPSYGFLVRVIRYVLTPQLLVLTGWSLVGSVFSLEPWAISFPLTMFYLVWSFRRDFFTEVYPGRGYPQVRPVILMLFGLLLMILASIASGSVHPRQSHCCELAPTISSSREQTPASDRFSMEERAGRIRLRA